MRGRQEVENAKGDARSMSRFSSSNRPLEATASRLATKAIAKTSASIKYRFCSAFQMNNCGGSELYSWFKLFRAGASPVRSGSNSSTTTETTIITKIVGMRFSHSCRTNLFCDGSARPISFELSNVPNCGELHTVWSGQSLQCHNRREEDHISNEKHDEISHLVFHRRNRWCFLAALSLRSSCLMELYGRLVRVYSPLVALLT